MHGTVLRLGGSLSLSQDMATHWDIHKMPQCVVASCEWDVQAHTTYNQSVVHGSSQLGLK